MENFTMKEALIRAVRWKKDAKKCPSCQDTLIGAFICLKCGIVEYNQDSFLKKALHEKHIEINSMLEIKFSAKTSPAALYAYAFLFMDDLFDDDMTCVISGIESMQPLIQLKTFCRNNNLPVHAIFDIHPWVKNLHDENANKALSREWLCDYSVEAITISLKERARALAKKEFLTPEEEVELIELTKM